MLAVLGIILGGAALAIALSRKAETAPPYETYIPTAEEIGMSPSIAKLNAYYDIINELYISGEINYDDYLSLYGVYEQRFYELIGVS